MKIHQRRTPEQVAKAAAAAFVCAARADGPSRGRFTVALAGGTTPKRLYELLAEPRFARRIDWSKVFVTIGDERVVPPDDPRSNYGMAERALLSRVPIPPRNVFAVPVELGATRAAEVYDRLVAELLGPEGSFDLVLLGMGEDGHTASLFPGAADETATRLAIPAHAPPSSPIHERVTLSYGAIAAARRVMLLVAGASKQDKLREALVGGNTSPIARVFQQSRGELTIVADRAALGG